MFVSWIRYHGRSEGLAAALQVRAEYVAVGRLGQHWTAPLRYVVQGARTAWLLVRHRPPVLVVMAPPSALVALGLLYQTLRRRPLLVDAHTNAVLGRGGAPRKVFLRLARHARVTIVTTEALGRVVAAHGVRTVVLHDPPFGDPAPDVGPAAAVARERPLLVMPSSWWSDEPLDELRRAAEATPEVDIVLTGRSAGPLGDPALWPPNVRLAGWLTDDDYRGLVVSATALIALTTRAMTMQRAGYEALILGRALVVSDSAVLREYFTQGAVFCRHEVDDMRRAFLEVAARHAELASAMTQLRGDKQQEFNAGLATIRQAIAN